MEQKPGQQQKDSKIQANEIRFLRAILNKTKKERVKILIQDWNHGWMK